MTAPAPGPTGALAVVLAAGAGARFAGPGHKLDAEIDGRTVLARALDAVLAGRRAAPSLLTEVLVVTSDRIRQALPAGVTEVRNTDPSRGLHSSLHLGIDHARRTGARRIVVALGDQPAISSAAWVAVADAGARSPIAVADYAGRPGHPVSLSDEVWPLLATTGEDGANRLMRQRPELVRAVPCDGSPADIDTLEDLQQWQSR